MLRKISASNDIAVKLTNISKRYTIHHEKPTLAEKIMKTAKWQKDEQFWALKDINLEIKKGERVGIIGPNGSGKTTLLKIIAGITSPTSGSVVTNGKIVSLIDLEAGFHPDLTGIQNIYLNGMLIGINKHEIDKKLKQMISFADIGGFIDAPLFTYSEGMKLRLGFAISLQSNPNILLIDEIFAIGDSNFKEKSLRSLKKLSNHCTLLVSSHDIGFLQNFARRIIIIEQNQIINDENSAMIHLLRILPINQIFYSMAQSNSMYPLIKQGDKLTIKKTYFPNVSPGNIIAFTLPNLPQIFVHRVVDKIVKNNQILCLTKGDNTYNYDAWEINEENYLGKVVKIEK